MRAGAELRREVNRAPRVGERILAPVLHDRHHRPLGERAGVLGIERQRRLDRLARLVDPADVRAARPRDR